MSGGGFQVDEGFQHTQVSVDEGSSWDRRRVGYVDASSSSSCFTETYLFCIRETGEGLEVGMDWVSKPVQDTALEYRDINEYTDEQFDGWDEAVEHLENQRNMREVAESYLSDDSTDFLTNQSQLRDEKEIEMIYTELF